MQLAALPASAGDAGAAAPVPVEEPHLVGAGAGGATIESAGSAVGAGSTTTQHPGYAGMRLIHFLQFYFEVLREN